MPSPLDIGKISLLLSSVSVLTFSAASPSSAYTLFQAAGPSSPFPFAAGTTAEASFTAALSAPVLVDSLDGLTPGILNGKTIFGGLGTLSQPALGGMSITTAGQCYSSSQCIANFPGLNPAFSISFSTPVQGFGFWSNDQNTVGDFITVLVNGTTTLGPSTTTQNAAFFGFIADNPSEYITSLAFNSGNPSGGFLTFDQFTTAPVPGPLPLAGAAAAFGFSRKLRHRIKSSRIA